MSADEQKNNTDPFMQFMFGKTPARTQHEDHWFLGRKKAPQPSTPLENLIKNIDFDQLYRQVDTIMTTAEKLKPLYKDAKKIISHLKN